MALAQLPKFIRDNYTVKEWRHASSILQTDFPELFNEMCDVLTRFRLKKSEIVVGGGSKTKIAGWIDAEFRKKGWVEKKFETAVMVDGHRIDSPTHKVDCFKSTPLGGIGFEIEWNNKDPFFDRDLNNFRLLFELRTLSVGIILTRAEDLKELFADLTDKGLKPASSFGESTTHWGKLLPRIEGGGGGGCPILAIGITKQLYTEDIDDAAARDLIAKAAATKKAARQAQRAKLQKKNGGTPILLDVDDEDAQDEGDENA